MVRLSSIYLGCLIVFTINAAENPEMYLCIDKMKTSSGKKSVKMVYGYINGKKTECMSEQEFKNKFYSVQINPSNDSVEIAKKPAPETKESKFALIQAVYRGKKNLTGVDLRGVDLKGCNLSDANLENANLQNADLRNCNLKGANLKGANLEGAYIKSANLTGADLRNAKLKGCYLHGANLIDTQGFNLESVRLCSSVYDAKIEEELLDVIKANCPSKLREPSWQWKNTEFSQLPDNVPENERLKPEKFH